MSIDTDDLKLYFGIFFNIILPLICVFGGILIIMLAVLNRICPTYKKGVFHVKLAEFKISVDFFVSLLREDNLQTFKVKHGLPSDVKIVGARLIPGNNEISIMLTSEEFADTHCEEDVPQVVPTMAAVKEPGPTGGMRLG